MPLSLRTIVPTSVMECENDSPLKQPPIDLRRVSSLDDMPAEIKEEMFKWILRELEEHQLVSSRLVHQVTLTKSDFDVARQEAFIIKDTVSTRKRPTVEKFLTLCRHKFRDRVDESNIQIELSCGYTKGDRFEGFNAFKQNGDGSFSTSDTMVSN